MKSQPNAHSWLAHPSPATPEPTDQTELLARHLYESSMRFVTKKPHSRPMSSHSIFASPRHKDIADRWRTVAADALIYLQKP